MTWRAGELSLSAAAGPRRELERILVTINAVVAFNAAHLSVDRIHDLTRDSVDTQSDTLTADAGRIGGRARTLILGNAEGNARGGQGRTVVLNS